MKKFYIFFSLLMFLLPETLSAQRVLKVSGEYTYYVPGDMSLDRARHIALSQAKVQLIADEFGTYISNTNIIRMEDKNGASNVNMMSYGESEVKGEWLETIGEPVYDIGYKNDVLYVNVKLAGRIREIVSASIDVQAKVLRNGTDARFESEEFFSGDEMFLSFQTPVDGYLTVYLFDGDQNVYCLLPYQSQTTGQVPVKANRSYTLFSSDLSDEIPSHIVDEYVLTCSKDMEFNRLYVIFSPNSFTKAVDAQTDDANVPRHLEFDAFQKWLSKCRMRDNDMTLVAKDITIKQR